MRGNNGFCLHKAGNCDPKLNSLLLIATTFGYPIKFVKTWKGNTPCLSWGGISLVAVEIALNFDNG